MTDECLTDIDAELGELLRFYRLSAGKSEKEIALAVNMPKAKLSGFERGKERISLTCFLRIAEALGMPASELLAQVERRINGEPAKPATGARSTLEFMASNRGRQLIRAWSQCDDPRLLDAFANLFMAASLQKKTEKTAARRPARVGN